MVIGQNPRGFTVTVSDPTGLPEVTTEDEDFVAPHALGDFFFPNPAERDVGSIIRWWERRRLPYNAIVGTAGLATISLLSLVFGPPGGAAGFGALVAPVALYGLMANVCFTMGWMLEALFHKLWGRDVLPVGPPLWRAGLIFSVGLTLVFPALLVVMSFVIRILLGIF